jgi:hypothetical protein
MNGMQPGEKGDLAKRDCLTLEPAAGSKLVKDDPTTRTRPVSELIICSS